MRSYDLIVVGGGPAGLAAALAAYELGVNSILLIERDTHLGGILCQCIHNGFGLSFFHEELTGPEYAGRFISQLHDTNIEVLTDAMVTGISSDHILHVSSPKAGYLTLHATAIVLAMGCRERTRGALSIPGERPAGILTAGAAQRYVNIDGYLVGRRVVIVGSGDIGLIMARRMTLEGAEVLACIEILPYSSGLTRNIVQCLNDYSIPLLLSHGVVDIRGHRRVEQLVAAKVDASATPIPGTEISFACDTVLFSVGLIPENELSIGAGVILDPHTGGPKVSENMETTIPGIFACGNAVHVHDLADHVSEESQNAGKGAAAYIHNQQEMRTDIRQFLPGENVKYTVPQAVNVNMKETRVRLSFRVTNLFEESEILVTTQAHEILLRFPRRRMSPGEMENILIPVYLLRQSSSRTFRVSATAKGVIL